MNKAIEYAKQIEGVTEEGEFCDPEFMPLVSAELLRLAAVEKQLEAAQAESVRLAAQLAEEKLRADRMTEQHRMQASISAAAQAELAAIRALEPVGWYCIRSDKNAKFLGKCISMNDPKSTNQYETVTPLYALPEQK